MNLNLYYVIIMTEEDYIYWAESRPTAILRIRRDLTQRQVIVNNGILGVESIAVDWIAGLCFYSINSFCKSAARVQ